MKKLKKIDGACAPYALKFLSGLPDNQVYDICEFNGYQGSTGMEEHEFIAAAKDMGIRLRRINLKKKNLYRSKLRMFIKHHSLGTYLIYTDSHLFSVRNGIVVDPLNDKSPGLNRLVTNAWWVYN